MWQVLLARHKETTNYYAVKVLQKKIIMKKKEVGVSLSLSLAFIFQTLRQLSLHTPAHT